MHKKKLTLTIVIPVYNEELYLPTCLDAIERQTTIPDGVIVVDNKSSDSTLKILQKYPFVKVIKEPRLGVIHARDAGFNNVSTDIIARIDDDTIISPNWVATLHKIFADKSIDAVAGPIGLYDIPFARFNYFFDHIMRRYIYMFGKKTKRPFLSGPNMAIRKKTWDGVKDDLCRDRHIHEDIDLAIHVANNNSQITYDSKLKASVSTRRYNDGFKDFRNYMTMFDYTYLRHDLHGIRIHSANLTYWLGYLLIHPFRKPLMYLNKFTKNNVPYDLSPRKNPN